MRKSTRTFPNTLHWRKRLCPLFWDYRPNTLSLKHDVSLIIARLLANGTWESTRWLRRTVGDDALRQWLIQHRGRGLAPQALRFWELILELDHRMVSSWMRRNHKNPWDRRLQA